jgi:hypothetical protein
LVHASLCEIIWFFMSHTTACWHQYNSVQYSVGITSYTENLNPVYTSVAWFYAHSNTVVSRRYFLQKKGSKYSSLGIEFMLCSSNVTLQGWTITTFALTVIDYYSPITYRNVSCSCHRYDKINYDYMLLYIHFAFRFP